MPNYYQMEFPDWVNIFPITSDGEVLLIKQYRHPSGKVHIEVPGGTTDPHRNETAEEGARRELLEETGYQCEKMIDLGPHYPNPALQSNRIQTYLALDCQQVSEQNLDPYEELSIYKCSLEQLKTHIEQGEIDHSLMLASIFKALTYKEKHNL